MYTENVITPELAIAIADRVNPVFPLYRPLPNGECNCGKIECPRPGKHPRTRHGVKDATDDIATICGWASLWPISNLAISMGQGRFTLDIDTKNGGYKSVALLEQQYGTLPETVEAQTGSGGAHKIYRVDSDIKVPNKVNLRPGLDIRGENGYIVAPPSLHASGNYYRWKCSPIDAEIAAAPQWLLDIILNAENKAESLNVAGGTLTEGERNKVLFKIGSSLWGRGVNENALVACIKAINLYQCNPPLNLTEVSAIVKSIRGKFTRGEIIPRYPIELPEV